MRHNLIDRLKEEWAQLEPVDPLRGLIADAIDALAEAQPSKPLTDEQMRAVLRKAIGYFGEREEFAARAIEAAHGIKGDA